MHKTQMRIALRASNFRIIASCTINLMTSKMDTIGVYFVKSVKSSLIFQAPIPEIWFDDGVNLVYSTSNT